MLVSDIIAKIKNVVFTVGPLWVRNKPHFCLANLANAGQFCLAKCYIN